MKTPDITPAQAFAGVQLLVGFLVARLLISNSTAQLVLQVASVVLPTVTVAADAFIRKSRVALAVERIAIEMHRDLAQANAAAVQPQPLPKP